MAKFSTVRETVDADSGEVLRTERSYTTRTSSEQFTQIFHEHPEFSKVFDVARLRDLHVILKLCLLCEYNTGRVKFGSAERGSVGQELDMSSANLSGSLSRLRKLGLISGRGSHIQLNPRLFWKGTTKARALAIEQQFPVRLPDLVQ